MLRIDSEEFYEFSTEGGVMLSVSAPLQGEGVMVVGGCTVVQVQCTGLELTVQMMRKSDSDNG